MKSFTSPSGAYITLGPRPLQIFADIPRSDALVAVLEIDEDCPGRVFTYFMRGGITESAMTVDELRAGVVAVAELLDAAAKQWPRKFPAPYNPYANFVPSPEYIEASRGGRGSSSSPQFGNPAGSGELGGAK